MTPEALIIESMFQVVSKDREDVPFILNSAQKELDDNLTGRDLIPKARQEGISTYFLARYTAACLSKRNVSAVIISHEGEATQRLLSRCSYFLDNIRGPKPVVGRQSINVITFPKTNGTIYMGTAGSKKFGRGDTISHLHCSEYAYWPDPKGLLSGLLQAVPRSGEIAIESTGNGKGNDYHRRVMRAANHESEWTCHFFNWQDFAEYTIPLTEEEASAVMDNLVEDWDEPNLVKLYNLSAGQIAYRRTKMEDMDFDQRLTKQEYPFKLDDCFQAAGNSIFAKVNFVPTKDWKDQGNHLWTLENHPIPNFTYCVGADPSGGVGGDGDNACIQVVCLDTMEQVAEYATNTIEPDILGYRVVDLAELYNKAFIVVESNNHGPVTLQAIRETDYSEILLYNMNTQGVDFPEDTSLMRMGFRTTSKTKPIMIGKLRTALAHELIIHSSLLSDELSTFIEHDKGDLAAQAGCKDDRVMALACCVMGLERAGLYAGPKVYKASGKRAIDPFLLDNIIEECHGKRSGFPIRPQNGTPGMSW